MCICGILVLVGVALVLSSGKADVSAPSVTTAVPMATRQDVYVGECIVYEWSSGNGLWLEQLAAIPEFAQLGNLFKSSEKAVELTESETEYVVCCVKHTFQKHIVFQVWHSPNSHTWL